ncbi:MAG: DUF5606 domain-containing protein [Bacteroidota bacterium]
MIDLHGFLAIAGYPGLYKVVAQAKNGVVVENISDKKRMMAHAHYRMSSLEDISIYTTADDVPLSEVMQKIHDKEKGGPAVSAKASVQEQLEYMESFFPEYDRERVHQSDIKKLFSWYNLLQETDNLKVKEEGESTEGKTEGKEIPKTAEEKKHGSFRNEGSKVKAVSNNAAKKTVTVRKTGA